MAFKAGTTNSSMDAGGTVSIEIVSITMHGKFWFLKVILITNVTAGRETVAYQHSSSDYPNVTLLRHGLLGSSPTHPTVAIHISVLDYYRQLHRECPRLSIQAQVKALCHLHGVRCVPFFITT